MSAVLPPLVLKADMIVNGPVDYWTEDDGSGDIFIGFPYTFDVSLVVTTRTHSSVLTRMPLSYDALDIKVGMWLSGNTTNGAAWRIKEIVGSPDSSNIQLIIEDVDRFNLVNDPLMTGGYPPQGPILIYETNDDGMPIFAGIEPNYMPDVFGVDLISRFTYRNLSKKFNRINQPGHDMAVGDLIIMNSDATYSKVAANDAFKDQLTQIVGQVTSVAIPGADWFTYKPRGEMQTDLALPADSVPGQLIYLDPVLPGKLTATKPKKHATPVYIRLDTVNRGIYLMGSAGGAVAGPLGYYASVYRVADLAERDAIDPTQLQLGDQAYVANAGSGEWAHYIVSAKTEEPAAVTWTKLVDKDASDVDGRTVSTVLDVNSQPAVDLYSVTPTTRVTLVTIEVITPFHTSASLNIGDDELHTRLVDDSLLDLSTAGTYTVTPSYQFGGTGETMVRAYLNIGTSTEGQAKVTISYV